MNVQIWADIQCPFCYIGKRRFEKALSAFPLGQQIAIEWKSFQLNPALKTDPDLRVDEYLAMIKKVSREEAGQLNDHVSAMAAAEGLQFDFSKAVVANSLNAHRLIQLAKSRNVGADAEEALFAAYFTEGKNIDDKDALSAIGHSIGLTSEEIERVVGSNEFADAVSNDLAEARYLGIHGVPFFVLNNRYGISGAQETTVLLKALETAFDEWQQENRVAKTDVMQGPCCSADGQCD